MITLILIALEGFFNSVMDTLKDHYSSSIFKNWDEDFWNPAISWQNKYKTWIPDAFTDGWHWVKLFDIVIILLAIVSYERIFEWWILDFLLFGIIRNVSFSLFYNNLLRG